MKCAKCYNYIVFDNNCVGLESLEVKCGNLNGAMAQKSRGILCSVCSSSRHYKYLNSCQNLTSGDTKMKTREFLRYFIGVLPDKIQNARAVVYQDERKFKNPDRPGRIGLKFTNADLNLYFDDALAAAFEEDF